MVVICKGEPFEYFCMGCGQLRLCANADATTCGNCSQPITISGRPGTLDGKKLKIEWKEKHK